MANLEGEWLERNKHRAYPFVSIPEPDSISPLVVADPVLESWIVDGALFVADQELASHVHGFNILDITVPFCVVRDFTSGSDVVFVLIETVSPDGDYQFLRGWDNSGKYYIYLVVRRDYIVAVTWALSPTTVDEMPQFASRTSPIRAAKVDSMSLAAGSVIVSLGEIAQLAEGNNIQLRLDPDTARIQALQLREPVERPPKHRIVISAIAGAGEGKVDAGCREPAEGVLTLNGQEPVDGNIQLVGDGCYRISRPAGTVDASEFDSTPNTIEIANDCQICCDCADFVVLLEHIRDLKDRGLAIKSLWEQARAAFNEVLTIWQVKQNCIGTDCIAQLYGFSYVGWLVTVQVWIGNPENCLKSGASISVSFGGGDYDPIYVPGSGHIYNDQSMYTQVDPTESGGVFTMDDNSAIKGSGYKIFVFSVRMQQSDDRVDDAVVNITAAAEMCGQDTESLGTSVRLRANLNRT